ncbi:MAG: ankyrin repeat domain-containing protein [Gemmatimonadetes bacterium]|nr:ankyrin repeat domain-containing protein [Gemmatimonadota bacterium]
MDENRWRPLNYAAASSAGRDDAAVAARLEAIVVLLLQRGAEVNRPPPPLTSAIGNRAMMQAMLDAGAKPDPGLVNALWSVDYDSVEMLLAAGADIRHPAVDDTLSELVQYGTYNMARFLVDRGANVNGVDDHRGRTALHWAAVRGAGKPFVTYLLDQGADPSIRDRDGATALDVAREKKRKAIESMLLERGRG